MMSKNDIIKNISTSARINLLEKQVKTLQEELKRLRRKVARLERDSVKRRVIVILSLFCLPLLGQSQDLWFQATMVDTVVHDWEWVTTPVSESESLFQVYDDLITHTSGSEFVEALNITHRDTAYNANEVIFSFWGWDSRTTETCIYDFHWDGYVTRVYVAFGINGSLWREFRVYME